MRVEDVLGAKEAGADFVGLMFAADSRRRLSIENAQPLVEAAGPPLRDLGQVDPPPLHRSTEGEPVEWFVQGARALERLLQRKRPLTVGVFEDQPMELVNEIADEVGLDLIQLSGKESWYDCRVANRQVVKTIEGGDEAVQQLESGAAVALLLDVSRGRGVPLDREAAGRITRRLPIWLAGGLAPENVGDVIRAVRPWAVDVSSGVETNGAKDIIKIRSFVQAAREASSFERSA
jgi:anthranilate synthase/indole-3-glycerol phosphate synthase/phosphoribosylanthranilate isomerase